MPCSERETFPVRGIQMEPLDDVFHASGFRVQDPGVLKLVTVTQVNAVLGHDWCVKMIQPDVSEVLLDPGLSGTPGVTSVDLTTFATVAVNTRCFQAKVIFDGPKEIGDLPSGEVGSFCVASC
jgi:hypothetical protein